jgi:hypothetical protein
VHAASFKQEELSIEVYDKLEGMNRESKDPNMYVSVYRLYQNWREKAEKSPEAEKQYCRSVGGKARSSH